MAVGQWPGERVAWLLAGMLGDPGLVYLVSGLSPYLPQGFPQQTREDNGCLHGSAGLKQIGEQGQFPWDFELLAVLLICGFVWWGGAVWVGRR